MSRQCKLAIVGLGGMGNWHRELIDTIDNLSVCGSYDILEEKQEYARSQGIKAYDSFEQLLADEEVDMILCSVPNDIHKEVTIAALRAGKHVVCEKPAAISSKEFEEMMEVSKETGKLLVVHQNRRWDEDYLTIKKIYEENLLGPVFKIESRVHGSRGIPGDWRKEKEHGGGMVLDWGVHILDQALQLIPEKITRVYSTLTNVTNELVDDGFSVTLTFENGLDYMLEVGTSNFISLPRWYMLGRDGTAVVKDWDLSGEIVRVTDWDKKDAVPVKTAAGLTKTMAPRTEDTIKSEVLPVVKSDIRDFYKNVMSTMEGNTEILIKNEEVLRVMRLMETIFESSQTHTSICFEK